MKLTKLFAIIISTCTLLSLPGMAGKAATSWRKDIVINPANYDERGYKGSDEKIFIAIYAEGELLDIAIKLVPTSYQDLMDEIWYTLERSRSDIKKYISQRKWDRKNLQLWNRTVSRQQMDLKGITVGSRWIVSDKLDPENQKGMNKLSALYREEAANPADYDANGYKGPDKKIFIVTPTLTPGQHYARIKVRLVTTSYQDLMNEIWHTLEHTHHDITKYLAQHKWDRENLQLWAYQIGARQQTDLEGITPESSWYIADKTDADYKRLMESAEG